MVVLLGSAALLVPVGSRAASLAVQSGDILIVNHGDNSVYRINPATGDQRRLRAFQSPTDLVISPDGYLYISEYRGTVQRLNLTNGVASVVNPLTSLWNVNGLALAPDGELYVTCVSSNSVVKIDPPTGNETVVTQGDQLLAPVGVDVLDSTHLAVSSLLANSVVSVSLVDGSQSVIAQGNNGIDHPWGIAVAGNDVYVAAKDSKLLQRVTGTGVSNVLQLASPIFGIGLDPEGNIVVGQVTDVARVSPAGALLRNFSGAYNEITGVEVSGITVEAAGVTNTPPVLGPLPDWTVDENTLVAFAVTATDTNWPPQVWTFSLGSNAPAGATITTNGVFTWTPGEAFGPGAYPVTIVVTDDGDPQQSASKTFTVTVNEVNGAPTIPGIPDRSVVAGTAIAFTVNGSDADLPPQKLTYALVPGAPEGATISADGKFFWVPANSQAPSTNVIRIKVTDDGAPALSATNFFVAVVNQVNVPPVFAPITNAVVGEETLLSFPINAFDSNLPAQELSFSLLPPIPGGAMLSPSGQFSWTPTEAQGPGTYTFQVQVTDNGSPPLTALSSFTVMVNESNAPPALAAVANVSVPLGTPIVRAFTATDADFPAQLLSFSLGSGAPAGATISSSGLFAWTPSDPQAVGTNSVEVVVSDSGTPSLSATQPFTVVVTPSRAIQPGDILAVDYGNNEVLQISPRSGATQSLGFFDGPTDLALAADGKLYVAEVFGTVQRVDLASGTVSLVNPGTALYDLWGIVAAPAGDLLVLNRDDASIWRIDPAGGGESLVTQSNLLAFPYSMDLLDDGHVVVASFDNDRIVSVDLTDGTQTLLAEGNGILLPSGVAASQAGIYVGSWEQGLVQRVSGGVVTNVFQADGNIESLAVETNGSVIVGVTGLETTLVRLNSDGSWSNLVSAGLIGPITGIDISRYAFNGSSSSNSPPIMAAIPNFIIEEGRVLTFTATAADADLPLQMLTFSLEPGAPAGAGITADGVFTWTPADAQGPATYSIGVIVTDEGNPPLSTTNHFAVTVNELYLQSSESIGGPYIDEPVSVFDQAAGIARIDLAETKARFYRLRCNLPVYIRSLRIVAGQTVLEYQFF